MTKPTRLATLAAALVFAGLASCAQLPIAGPDHRTSAVAVPANWSASQSETLQITQWRYEAGLTSSSDVDQARTNLEQTRASIPDLETGQAAAQNRIAVLLGRSPGSLNDRLAGAPSLPAVPDSVATGIPADVLTRRPDLVSAERNLAAETARTGQKMAQRFPSLNLSGSFGWQAYSLAALGGAGTLYTSLAGTLAATLFDGGRLRSAVEASRSAATQARQMYESGLSDFQKLLETENEVLWQLLIETAVLSAFGRLAGVLLAFVACTVLSALMHMPFLFGVGINLLAFGFSTAISMLVGYVLAGRAARLDPIEDL